MHIVKVVIPIVGLVVGQHLYVQRRTSQWCAYLCNSRPFSVENVWKRFFDVVAEEWSPSKVAKETILPKSIW